MKLASLTVFILISIFGLAQTNDRQESTYLKVKISEDVTTYEFQSIQDFEENSEKILDEIFTSNPINKKEKDIILTIEISITVIANNKSTTITGSITNSIKLIINETKKLRTQLLAIAVG